MAEEKKEDIQVNADGSFVEKEPVKNKHTLRKIALIIFGVVVVACIVLAIIGIKSR